MHPLLHLISTRPQLLATHAQAYSELVSAEFVAASAGWKRRAMLNALALCGLGAAVVLAGVAVMLWAVMPQPQIHAPWALYTTPLWPLAAAAGCLWAARRHAEGGAFGSVRRQVAADIAMWREAAP